MRPGRALGAFVCSIDLRLDRTGRSPKRRRPFFFALGPFVPPQNRRPDRDVEPRDQPDTDPNSDNDFIWGCSPISKEIGRTERGTFHLLSTGKLPARRSAPMGRKPIELRAYLRGELEV